MELSFNAGHTCVDVKLPETRGLGLEQITALFDRAEDGEAERQRGQLAELSRATVGLGERVTLLEEQIRSSSEATGQNGGGGSGERTG